MRDVRAAPRADIVGAGLVALAAACFGTLGPLSRFAGDAGVEALTLVTWRAAIGAVVVTTFIVLAWWLRGLLAGILAFVGFALIDSVELWDEAMDTLTLVLVATIVTLVLAVPLGIWASRSKTVSAVIRPVLDFMQTMPAMVYLIPGVIFFGVGVVPGIIATIIFALPRASG